MLAIGNAILSLTGMPALAEIRFVEVTGAAGLEYSGGTYGASWGDFNGDGWPDLWVGNHIDPPRLYLNRGDGGFQNITDKVWSSEPHADDHGAAWADFDNDGDQDLLEVVDAERGQYGWLEGAAPNHLFVNEDGVLKERAHQMGLDFPSGLERTPLWLDANGDGLLDVLMMRERRRDKLHSSLFIRQGAGFKPSNEVYHFHDSGWSRNEKWLDFIDNAMHLRLQEPHRANADGTRVFAQLGDISGDGQVDLIAYSKPVRVYETNRVPFEEITNTLNFPQLESIQDAAIADFDGDARMDLYLTRARYWTSQFIQVNEAWLKGHIVRGANKGQMHVMRFTTDGMVEFELYPVWMDPIKIRLGSDGHQPEQASSLLTPPQQRNPHLLTYPPTTADGKPLKWDAHVFRLSPADAGLKGPVTMLPLKEGGIAIEYDADKKLWTVHTQEVYVDFNIRSEKPIRNLELDGFVSSRGELDDRLLLNSGKGFVAKITPNADTRSACQSVAAGDFDNDMDVDVYLVCTGPAENLPNRLYENDGKGNFRIVDGAGGAAGSQLGRGDSVVMADYDRDGFLDLFVVNGADPVPSPFTFDGPYQLFKNAGNGNHWLELDLEGVKSNRDGIGALVKVTSRAVTQVREQSGGMHRFSQHHQRLHFGLGTNAKADLITVRWPDGRTQELHNVTSNQVLHIREADGSIGP